MVYTLAVAAVALLAVERLRPELSPGGGVRPLARELVATPWRFARAVFRPAPIDDLTIDIQFKFLHLVHEKRAEALRLGRLSSSKTDLVEATVTHSGRSVPVRLRLDGDVEDGLRGEKWPMRIEAESDHYVLGMRRFRLLDPAAHGFQAERMAAEHLRSLGIATPRTRFVRVAINGKTLGTMLLIEHYAKELLEGQRRRDGVILRFDDDAYRATHVEWGDGGVFDNHRLASLGVHGSGRVRRSKTLSAQRDTASALLRGFLAGKLPAHAVFDVELMAAYLAAAELWRSESALEWENQRFYYNPVSSRIEPVAAPFAPHHPRREPGLVAGASPLAAAFLADTRLRDAFVEAAHTMADSVLDGDLLDRLASIETQDVRALQREYPWRVGLPRGPLEARARWLRTLTTERVAAFGANSEYANPIAATLRRTRDGFELTLRNRLPVAARVMAITERRGDDPERDLASAHGLALPIALPPTALGSEPAERSVRWTTPLRKRPRIAGIARIDGASQPFAFRAKKATPSDEENPVAHPTLEDLLTRHPFLRSDDASSMLTTAPGGYEVRGSLILPEGYGLRLPAGTELRFEASEGLIARGPLHFEGSAEAPVVLTGPASDDPDGRWSGIAVLGAQRTSRWSHVHVHNTGVFRRGGWRPTGSVLFRKAEIQMEHCRILDALAEDALNLVRSPFSLENVEIEDARSDALDIDFSDGSIIGGAIRKVGGDGIDVSGARVSISDVTLQGIGDKAISVGEASRVNARSLDIRRVGTAFVSKDLSRAELRDSRIREVVHVALMAYVKKPVFGPAELVAEDNDVEDYGSLALAQTGSRVFIDGAPVPEQDVDIAQLYRDGYMQK